MLELAVPVSAEDAVKSAVHNSELEVLEKLDDLAAAGFEV